MTKKQIDKALLEGCGEGDYNKVRLALNFGADVRTEDKWDRLLCIGHHGIIT